MENGLWVQQSRCAWQVRAKLEKAGFVQFLCPSLFLSYQRRPMLRMIADALELAIQHRLRNLMREKRLIGPHRVHCGD
jgi:hypothetical protein